MKLPQPIGSRNLEHSLGDVQSTALESLVVNETIGNRHDVGIHTVLVFQVDDRARVGFREATEQADPKVLSFGVPNLQF